MLNIKKNKNNKVTIQYNTVDGVKSEKNNNKPLRIVKDDNGELRDLTGDKYSISDNGDNIYHILFNEKYKSYNHYLNTVLSLSYDFFNQLEPPTLVFYDIETSNGSVPEKNAETGYKWKLDNKTKINSIAWIDYQTKDEYCLVRGIDGSEKVILRMFCKYCIDNHIMGVIGHNSYKFDNIVMVERLRKNNLWKYISIFFQNCNLDTMVLAKFLNYSDSEYISLNDLSVKIRIGQGKTDTGIYNPVTLYKEAMQEYKENNNELLSKFKEYTMQDAKLSMSVFDGMNCLEQLNTIFMQTFCPFDKMHKNSYLLNSYTCKEAFRNKIVIPAPIDTKIKFKNKGGYNYYTESETLQVHENIIDFDIVSYYPNLLRLIGADNTYDYANVNRETGEIKPFKVVPNGFLSELASNLYKSRAKTKELRNRHPKNSNEYKKLDYEQLTKKIIVNSLYGVLSQEGNYYILKNELIGATITALGRDLLRQTLRKFDGVYGKTDSIFIPMKGKKPAKLLSDINNYVNRYLRRKYNLVNVRDGKQIIKFEINETINKLIIKDKNNYIKITDNDEIKYKGGSFNNTTHSTYEKELIKTITSSINENKNNKEIIKKVTDFTNKKLRDNSNLQFFSKTNTLSKKQKEHSNILGRFYMDDNNIPYVFNFKYLNCRVNGDKYDYIMYPNRYKPENLVINPLYVYKMMITILKNYKIINGDEEKEFTKRYNIKELDIKAKKIKEKYNTNTEINIEDEPIIDKNSSNNQVKITDDIKSVKSIKSKQFKNIKNKFIKELNKLIPDTAEYYEKGLLTFIPVWKNTKKGKTTGYKFNPDFFNNYDVSKYIDYNDNIGLIRGYKGLCVLDTDGEKYIINKDGKKVTRDTEENKKIKDILKNILETIDYPFIIQKTQSGGYHFLYYSHDSLNFDLTNISYPDDFEIKDLRGKPFSVKTIEVFQELNGYIIFTPSKTYIDGVNGGYKLLSDSYRWKQIFENPVENIEIMINDAFKENGFVVKPREPRKKIKQNKTKNKTININLELKKKLWEDNKTFNLLVEVFKQGCGAHNDTIIPVYTSVLKYLGFSDNEAYDYMENVLEMADDCTTEHKAQVKSRINTNNGTKPNVKKRFETEGITSQESKELIHQLDTYLNSEIRISEGISTHTNTITSKNEQSFIFKHYINRIDELRRSGKLDIIRNMIPEIMGECFGVVRRRRIGTPYILDKKANAYIKTDIDDLFELIENFINIRYFISDDNIKSAIKRLSNRVEPDTNYVKLKNCIINMRTAEPVKVQEPKLCLLNIPYNYNPEARSTIVDDYFYSSLYDIDEETTKEKINGLYEFLGYLLTSGNKEEVLLFLVGKKGGGKSIMGKIITTLVGGNQNICDVKLDEMAGNNSHATAPFINAHINLISEQDKKPIRNTGIIKQVSGNDAVMVNPKGKDQVLLIPEEVPKTVIMCNNLPDLRDDSALIDRVITLQFKKTFRNTEAQIKDLDKLITENDEAMEYILYNALTAYREVAQGNKELTLRKSEEETLTILAQNTDPITFYLDQLIQVNENFELNKDNQDVIEDEMIASNELPKIIKFLGDKDGVAVPSGKDGLPSSRTILSKIRNLFNVDDKEYFATVPKRHKGKAVRYYNHLAKTEYYKIVLSWGANK